MGCGCGQKRVNGLDGVMLSTEPMSSLTLNDAGLYNLAAAPDCTEPYNGAFPAATLYIADRGGPLEKMFLKSDYGAASDYARVNRVTLVHLAAKQLCSATVTEFLGA